MVITTRQVSDDDHDRLRATHHLAYHDVVVAQFGGWDESRQDQFFADKWLSGQMHVLLCDGLPCGFVRVNDEHDSTHVVELVVHPDWQRRGIGTQFLRSVMDSALARHVPVRLRVLHQNQALRLYKRLGFVERGKSPTHFELEWAGGRNSHGQ